LTLANRVLTGLHFFQGDEACAEGALAAGCQLFAGYPITPSTEISERMSTRIFEVGGIFVQGADELDSLAIVIGAACCGWKTMTATSGNGISLMQESIGFAAMIEAPCVIVDVQRVGPAAGAATKAMQGDVYQVRYGSTADYSIIALAPNSPQEMFDMTVQAFNLAERYRVPTFILADEIIGHMRERVTIPDPEELEIVNRKKPDVPPEDFVPFRVASDIDIPPMPSFGEGYRLPISSFSRTETGSPTTDAEITMNLITRIWNKIEKNADTIGEIESRYIDDCDFVVLSYGSPSRPALKAVMEARREELKVGYVRLKTLWPFPDNKLKKILEDVNTILVLEMNMGKMIREVQRVVCGTAKIILFSKPGVSLHSAQEILQLIRREYK